MASSDLQQVSVRAMVVDDALAMARAFASIQWSSKPVALFERYFEEQRAGTRRILVAFSGGEFAGYVTVNWQPTYEPLAMARIPELQDLNVLPSFRRRGIGTRLMKDAEELVATRSERVGLAVGLHPGYNAAQRMHALRGYVPDGNGATAGGEPVREGQAVILDDTLVLHLVKDLSQLESAVSP